MKNLIIIMVLSFVGTFNLTAQEQSKSGFDAGFQINQFANDFGLGVTVSSPWIFKEVFQIRLRANAMYFEYVKDRETTWEPYYNLMLSTSSGTKINQFIRLYGEGGVALIMPSNKFSSKSTEIGGFGLFGFEFYFDEGFAYFIEAGGMGLGATADKIENKPIYSNGFLTSVGFRIKL